MRWKSLFCLCVLVLCVVPVSADDGVPSPSLLDTLGSMVMEALDAVCELGGTLTPIGCDVESAAADSGEPDSPPAELGGTLTPIG